MKIFFDSFSKVFTAPMLNRVIERSLPWDDGYSQEEINTPVNEKNLRFSKETWEEKTRGKRIIFVPNRIGGKGRSSDYTNCGKFMFELLPQLHQLRQDFVVICGNPSQKIFNHELEEWCGKDGYVSLVPDAFNRDEFKFVARRSHIAAGLYDQDTYGGTVARECIELGCLPLWIDNFEYSSIAQEAGYGFLGRPDFSDLPQVTSKLIDFIGTAPGPETALKKLQEVVRNRCSYEATTPVAMKVMGLL